MSDNRQQQFINIDSFDKVANNELQSNGNIY